MSSWIVVSGCECSRVVADGVDDRRRAELALRRWTFQLMGEEYDVEASMTLFVLGLRLLAYV